MANRHSFFRITVVQGDEPARNRDLHYIGAKDVVLHAGKHLGGLAVLAASAELDLHAIVTLGARTTIIRTEALL